MDAIATRRVNGAPALVGPAAIIRAALDSDATLTITVGPFAGDTVRIGSAYAPEPGQEGGWAQRKILQEFTHPQHGEILSVAINLRDLDDAPRIAAHEAKVTAETTAAEKRIAAEDARLAQLDRNI